MSAKEPWSSLNALKEEVNALLKKNDVTEQTKKQLSELEVLADDLNKKMNVLKEEAANALKEQLQQLIDSKKQTVFASEPTGKYPNFPQPNLNLCVY